jgi:hypothetical protein
VPGRADADLAQQLAAAWFSPRLSHNTPNRAPGLVVLAQPPGADRQVVQAAEDGRLFAHSPRRSVTARSIAPGMAITSLSLAIPDDPDLLARLSARLRCDGDPPVTLRRTSVAVLRFEAPTGAMMLRSRVIQALTDVAGPDWQDLVRPLA